MISLYLQKKHIVPVMAPLMYKWGLNRMRSYRLKAVLPNRDIAQKEPHERILACMSITGQAFMSLREQILLMFREENLTIGEIAGALKQDPNYVYEVIYKSS